MRALRAAIWFPTVRTGTGTDVFTERLVDALLARGIPADISWLPLRAEYAPHTVAIPAPPRWATVVHVNTWLHPRFIPAGLPLVATLHHAVHDPAFRPYKSLAQAAYHRVWMAPRERRVMRRADRVIAVSEHVAESATRCLAPMPFTVIPNGVDVTVFQLADPPRLPGRPFRLLYVGSWIRRKGVHLFAPLMRELGEGFELRYTGLCARPSASDVAPNMRDIGRLGTQYAVADAMRDADAFLFPSYSEGFGLVVAEAMACGLPVVATRNAAVAELVEHGVTGLLAPMDDIGALATAVRRIATDSNLHSSMGAAARARVEEHFSIPAMTDAYVECYRDIVARQHP